MGCGGFGEDRAAVCRGCSTGVSLEEHRDQKRAQGLQQQWGTQGLKGGSYSSVHLRAGSSEKQKSLLGHRTPGSWNRVGWWESAKPQGHLSKQPQGISAAPAPPPGAGRTRVTATQHGQATLSIVAGIPQPSLAGRDALWCTAAGAPCRHSS